MNINDNTFFGLYRKLNDLTPVSAGHGSCLTSVEGSYQFKMVELLREPKTRENRLTLRIDSKLGTVSGDVMAMGTGHWRFSFLSEAVFQLGNDTCPDIVVMADAFSAPDFLTLADAEPKALLMLKFGPNRKLVAARLAALLDHGNAAISIADLCMQDKRPTRKPSLRQIELRAKADVELVEDDFYGPLLEEVVGNARAADGIIPKLKTVGFDVIGEKIAAMEMFGLGDEAKQVPQRQVQSDNILDAYSRLSRLQFANNPFLYSLLFAGHSRRPADLNDVELDDAERQRRLVFGTAVGLDSGIRRYRNRFGALVLPKEIARSYLEYLDQKEGHQRIDEGRLREMLKDPSDLTALAIRKRIRERIEHTAIHELGHLLNLPHPWQRDRFPGARHGANPAARSWMNYTTRYPFGAANELAFGRHAAEAARWLRYDYSEDVMNDAQHLGDMSFSEAEQMHLRHAPFDEIAVGQKTFVDGLRAAPAIRKPDTGTRHLTLTLQETQEEDDALGEMTYRSSGYIGMRPSESRRPVIGSVSMPVEAFPAEFRDHMQFGFGAGALRLVIEGRPNDRYGLPLTRIYDAPLYLDETRSVALNTRLQSTLALREVDGEQVFLASLPILPARYLFNTFAPRQRFRLQVLFLPPQGAPVASNVVNLRYKDTDFLEAVGAKAMPKLLEILGSKDLPLLWEAVHYLAAVETGASASLKELIVNVEAFDLSMAKEQGEVEWLRILQTALRVQRNAGADGSATEAGAGHSFEDLGLLPESVLCPLMAGQESNPGIGHSKAAFRSTKNVRLPTIKEVRQQAKQRDSR